MTELEAGFMLEKYPSLLYEDTCRFMHGITCNGEEMDVVADFFFLGALVEREGRCEKEIRRRITLGKWQCRVLKRYGRTNMSLQRKTRIVNATIFPVLLYGCETWTKTRSG